MILIEKVMRKKTLMKKKLNIEIFLEKYNNFFNLGVRKFHFTKHKNFCF